MVEKVVITDVNLITPPSEDESHPLVDLIWSGQKRDSFHKQLAQLGYYVGEGEAQKIESLAEMGTKFSVYKLDGDRRTGEKVGEITTYLENDEV